MRRQRRPHHDDDDYQTASSMYQPLLNDSADFLQMERLPRIGAETSAHRFENTLEAKVEVGDTLQALALKFHCSVADIKRLNKIDKDNEIHARKVLKIPVTVHSVLLGTLPAVHKSGNNSPKQPKQCGEEMESNIMRNPLEDARVILSEKLMVASVNAAGVGATSSNINSTILNSKMTASSTIYTDGDPPRPPPFESEESELNDVTSALLDDAIVSHPRPIRGPSLSAIDWSGSDCDMSWVCLFVFILALCFVIPLIIVIHKAEHPHHHNTTSH